MSTVSNNARPGGRIVAPPRHAPPRLRAAAAVSLMFTLPALVATAASGLPDALALDMTALANGEFWRMVTGHWVHWSLDHLLWSGATFALLMLVGWGLDHRMTLLTVLSSIVLIPVGLRVLAPELTLYGGLSGIDSALFVFVGLTMLMRELAAGRRAFPGLIVLLLIGFVGKVAFEFATGQTVFASSEGMTAVPAAHVIGGACGAMLAFLGGIDFLPASLRNGQGRSGPHADAPGAERF